MTLQRIISGGQTGADRAALDAAIDAGFPCGGWCPEGRKADDGPIPDRYPVEELAGAGYRKRTIRNLQDSDGTAIFGFGEPVGGTALTLAQCIRLQRPHQLIDAGQMSSAHAAEILVAFIEQNQVGVLNVAGPSERRTAEAYDYVLQVITTLLTHAATSSRPAPATPLRTSLIQESEGPVWLTMGPALIVSALVATLLEQCSP